jgi:hypothetical protein
MPALTITVESGFGPATAAVRHFIILLNGYTTPHNISDTCDYLKGFGEL